MIEWTEQAVRQLDQAHDYIALSNSQQIAARIVIQIVSKYPPAEPGALVCEPLKAAVRGR